jgi:alpha-L-fucosidase 2
MVMKILSLYTGLLFGICATQLMAEVVFSGNAAAPADTLCLWYRMPAAGYATPPTTTPETAWNANALPLGNGRMGAMIFGGVQRERIQFNEKTLWTGNATVGVGSGSDYQSFGYVTLDFPGFTAVTNYRRILSLDSAIHRVEFTVGNVSYVRESFISYPENLMVVRLYSTGTAKISFTASLVSTRTGEAIYAPDASTIALSDKLTIVSYEARLNVLANGGTVSPANNQLTVTGADTATLFLCASTDYSPTTSSYTNGAALAGVKAFDSTHILASRAKSYASMRAAHIADHQNLFNRMRVRLANNAPQTKPTDSVLIAYKTTPNPMLDILILHLGRYFTIATSRDNCLLPSNLQGLWKDDNTPGWSCDFHTDINVEMNYFGAEAMNLMECVKPYTSWIYNQSVIQPNWKKYANNNGWRVYTQNNIYGQSNWSGSGNYYGLSGWLCLDLWKYFAFSMDTAYLRTVAYPAMKLACTYYRSVLTLKGDTLLFPTDDSPEQGITDVGPSWDQQCGWDLFTNTVKACTILNTDLTFRDTIKQTLTQLDNGMRIGSWGQIKEWRSLEDYNPATKTGVGEPGHRHCSPMICLYPGTELQPLSNPKMATALKTLLDARGTGGYGWSNAWRMALRARLFDGNAAYSLLGTYVAGSVQANLFDLYGGYIFQIDANYGVPAALTEMLVQSNEGMIHLMPAIPDAWATQGEVKGVRARGGFEVTDLVWSTNKHFVNARIKSYSGDTCKVKLNDSTRAFKVFNAADGSLAAFTKKADVLTFPTTTGNTYLIDTAASVSVRSNHDVAICQSHLSLVGKNRVTLTVSRDGVYTVKFISLNGRVISAQNIAVSKGKTVVALDAAAARQVIVMSVSGNGVELSKKFLIQ